MSTVSTAPAVRKSRKAKAAHKSHANHAKVHLRQAAVRDVEAYQDMGIRIPIRTLQAAYPCRSIAELARSGYDFSLEALIEQAADGGY